MSGIVFSNEKALSILHDTAKASAELSLYLFQKLGVRPPTTKIVIIAISQGDTMYGCDVLMLLVEECEKIYGRKVELSSLKMVSLSSLEAAKRSPYLEMASFILVTDEDLLGASEYPELERILKFE